MLDQGEVTLDQATALLHVVTDYAYALDLLDDYDHQPLRLGQPARSSGWDQLRKSA